MSESYKVALLGEADVGKKDIINTFITNTFISDSVSKSAQFVRKTITLENNEKITFDIWDTAGQEKYRSMAKNIYKDAKVIIFVYDITNKKSFDEIKNYWYEQTKQKFAESNTICALVGNKCDLYDFQVVNIDEAKEFAKSINAIFALITDKSKNSIQNLFEIIARKIIDPSYDYTAAEDKVEKEYIKKKLMKEKEIINNDNNNNEKIEKEKKKEEKEKEKEKKKEKCIII